MIRLSQITGPAVALALVFSAGPAWAQWGSIKGQVVFDGKPLRELLVEAIRYGEEPEVRARLTKTVENAFGTQQDAKVAKRLGISQSLVYGWVESGVLPCYRMGAKGKRGCIRIDPDELAGFLAGLRNEAATPDEEPLVHLK